VRRLALNEHSVLLLNSRLVEQSPDSWDERGIATRSAVLLNAFNEIWPRPELGMNVEPPPDSSDESATNRAPDVDDKAPGQIASPAQHSDEATAQDVGTPRSDAASRAVIRDQLIQGRTPGQIYRTNGKTQAVWVAAIEEEAKLAGEYATLAPTLENVVALREERQLRWEHIAARVFGDAGRVSDVRALYDEARGEGVSQRSYTGRGRRFPEMDM
jgi:hypothetical protein